VFLVSDGPATELFAGHHFANPVSSAFRHIPLLILCSSREEQKASRTAMTKNNWMVIPIAILEVLSTKIPKPSRIYARKHI
jgi:hypothetical protein